MRTPRNVYAHAEKPLSARLGEGKNAAICDGIVLKNVNCGRKRDSLRHDVEFFSYLCTIKCIYTTRNETIKDSEEYHEPRKRVA